jgi:hypothetical protein
MSKRVESNLVLHLTAATGVITLDSPIRSQTLNLVSYSTLLGSAANSLTAGGIIIFEIENGVNSANINSNLNTKGSFALMNDTTTANTVQSNIGLSILSDRDIPQKFSYRVLTAAGSVVANLTSLSIVVSYLDNKGF